MGCQNSKKVFKAKVGFLIQNETVLNLPSIQNYVKLKHGSITLTTNDKSVWKSLDDATEKMNICFNIQNVCANFNQDDSF